MKIDVIKFTSEELRRVIVDSFCFYDVLKGDDLFALKRTDLEGMADYKRITPVEKKTLALFLGLLNSDNHIKRSFNKRGIKKQHVLDYLGYDNIDVKETDFRRLEQQFEILNFVDYLNIKGEEVTLETLAHLLMSSSDIISNFFYSEISRERSFYNSEKMRIREMYEESIKPEPTFMQKIGEKIGLAIQ